MTLHSCGHADPALRPVFAKSIGGRAVDTRVMTTARSNLPSNNTSGSTDADAPDRRRPCAVRLEFAPGALVHANLSGAAFTGSDWLWVVGDEAASIDRLRRLPPVGAEALRFGEGHSVALADLIDVPGDDDEEADLEGMAVEDGWLWVVGSHGLKRKNAKPGRGHASNAKRLAKLALDGNRRLLACIPIDESDAATGPRLAKRAADGRCARRLDGDAENNALTTLLRDDPHFGPFLGIPGKDNGFDVEGLAVFGPEEGRAPGGQHLLLGLRGPVLRGWAALLEIAVEPRGDDGLKLVPLCPEGPLLRKHFLQLGGMGVRDLHFRGDDLYLLAGPTMVLDGEIRVVHWPDARRTLLANTEPARFETDALVEAVELPHGHGEDRAEALTSLPPALEGGVPGWLVLYDAPSAARRDGELTVFGDLLAEG